MPATLTVRAARFDDLPAIIALLSQLYSDPNQERYDEARASYEAAFAQIESDLRQTLYVAEQDGRIVASAVLIVVPNLTRRGRPYGIVENVITDASERGRGHGEAVMRRIIEDARAAGCHKVALMSRNERTDAHRFYERLGLAPAHVGFRLDL